MNIEKFRLEPQQQKKLFRILEFVYLACLFGFYFLWACTQPMNAGPDEEMRYQIPMFIYQNHALPHGGDPSIRNPIWGISYGFNPIFSYMISALFMAITSIFTTDAFALLVAARMVSVLSGVGTAYFTIQIAKKLLPQIYRPPFVILVTLLPQMVFLTSYVNNDAMALCSTAMIVYMWIRGIETNWDKKSCIGLALSISLCALSYYNAYGFILCSILLFGFTAALRREKTCTLSSDVPQENMNYGIPCGYDFAGMWKKGLLISAIVLICISWWFLRNAVIYDGDFLARKISREYAELYATPGFKPSDHGTPMNTGRTLKQMLFDDHWLWSTKVSFVGVFGNMKYYLPFSFYNFYIYPFVLGFLGMLPKIPSKFRLRKEKKWNLEGIFHLTLAAAMIIPVFLSIYYSYTSDFQPQGRYILPMIIPFAYFVVQGIATFLEFFVKKERIRIITYGYSLVWILIAVLSYTQVIYPTYH
ncbi:MAG: DUF2142 domain-containing protein [Lachnospiraceae bacterium]